MKWEIKEEGEAIDCGVFPQIIKDMWFGTFREERVGMV